ncbi:MAG: DUF2252 domain-containing protein [Bdellovibrionaceae bacterium]|nr:DUF2252 domain-containing protein [Pseudobdellovibrionaceae bacterium]
MQFRTHVFEFYRYFLHIFKRDETLLPSLTWQGWVLGDPHPGNFGFILLADGESRYTFNDYDDFGRGPLILDITRLVLGTYLQLKELGVVDRSNQTWKWENQLVTLIKESYLQGLNDSVNFVLSPSFRDYLNKKKPREFVPSPGDIEGETIAPKEDRYSVAPAERKYLEKILVGQVSDLRDWKLADLKKRVKTYGGSRGLERYLTLWKKGSTLLLLEWKPIVASQLEYFFPSNDVDGVLRTELAWDYFIGKKRGPWYVTVWIYDKPFKSRPLYKDQSSLKWKADWDSVYFQNAIKLNAFLLGQFHRQSFKDQRLAEDFFSSLQPIWDWLPKALKKQLPKFIKKLERSSSTSTPTQQTISCQKLFHFTG